MLTYYSTPDLSRVQKLEFVFRYCGAFSPRKKELYIRSLLKARVGQVGLLAKIS